MRYVFCLLTMLVMATTGSTAHAVNLGTQKNIVDEFFYKSHYLKMVFNLCGPDSDVDGSSCKKTSTKKRIILYKPTKYENAYDTRDVYLQVAVGRGEYIGLERWVRKEGATAYDSSWELGGVRDAKFTYYNDGEELHLVFDTAKGESEAEDPAHLTFLGKRILREMPDPGTETTTFALIPEIKYDFVANNMIVDFFKKNPDTKELTFQKCNGPLPEGICSRTSGPRYVVDQNLLKLAKPVGGRTVCGTPNPGALMYTDDRRGYDVVVDGTGVIFSKVDNKVVDGDITHITWGTCVEVRQIQKDVGIYDLGYEPNHNADRYNSETGELEPLKHRFTFYKIK